MNLAAHKGPLGQKVAQFISQRWRKSANGKPCAIQLPGCEHEGTTVLCHIRMFSWAGMGQKPHDFLAFYGCNSCHAKQERGEASAEDILLALGKTLTMHYEEGRLLSGYADGMEIGLRAAQEIARDSANAWDGPASAAASEVARMIKELADKVREDNAHHHTPGEHR